MNIFSLFHLFEFICCVYCGILIISGLLIAKVWRTLRVPLFLVLSGKNLLKLVINMAQSSTRCMYKSLSYFGNLPFKDPCGPQGKQRCGTISQQLIPWPIVIWILLKIYDQINISCIGIFFLKIGHYVLYRLLWTVNIVN